MKALNVQINTIGLNRIPLSTVRLGGGGKSFSGYIKEGLVYEWNCLNIAPSIDDGVWTACVGDNSIALTDACTLAEDGGLAVASTEEVAMAIANEPTISDGERIIEFVCKLDTSSSMYVELAKFHSKFFCENSIWKNYQKFKYGATGVYLTISSSIEQSNIWSIGASINYETMFNGKTGTSSGASYYSGSVDNKQVTTVGNVEIYAIRIYDASLITSCSVKEMFVTNNKWNQKNFGNTVPSNALYDDSGNLLYDDSGNIIGSDN